MAGWVIRFSDDAWAQYAALSEPKKDRLRETLFSHWMTEGPKADGVRLINGVLFREADLLFGIRLAWLVPNDSPQEIWVVKIRQLDE
jgi:hypothetical protein